MQFAYFLSFFDPTSADLRISEVELQRVTDIVESTPELSRGLIFQAESSVGPLLSK